MKETVPAVKPSMSIQMSYPSGLTENVRHLFENVHPSFNLSNRDPNTGKCTVAYQVEGNSVTLDKICMAGYTVTLDTI